MTGRSGTVAIRQTTDRETVAALHTLCLPGDDLDIDGGAMWLAWKDETPVGFSTTRVVDKETIFLSRSGVLPLARGERIQIRMIRARESWARREGYRYIITYTTYDNHPSICSLIKAGYRFYEPSWPWAGRDVHYYLKEL